MLIVFISSCYVSFRHVAAAGRNLSIIGQKMTGKAFLRLSLRDSNISSITVNGINVVRCAQRTVHRTAFSLVYRNTGNVRMIITMEVYT